MVARAVTRTGNAGRFGPPLRPPAPSATQDDLKVTESRGPDASGVTAESISDRLLHSFEAVANDSRTKQIIADEVNNYLRLGRKTVTDDDIRGLEARIRGVLLGAGPTRNTRVLYKKAIADADDWSRLYKFQDKLGEQQDAERRRRDAERQAVTHECLARQVAEQQGRLQQQSAEEVAYSRQQDADRLAWHALEERKTQRRRDEMRDLKADVETQLAERRAQKKLEAALKLQEEQGSYTTMVSELRAKMEAETSAAAKARDELRTLLLSNETNKAAKEKQRLEDQALDRKYAREYAEKLDKEERGRQEALTKRMEYQAQQAAIAQSLPESKRWIDDDILESHCRAREEAEAVREAARRNATESARATFKAELAEQIAQRQADRVSKKADAAAEAAALEHKTKREAEAAAAEQAQLRAKREALRDQLEAQHEDAIRRKLAVEPAMTKTEREINADMLRRMRLAETQRNGVAFVA